MGLQRRVRLGDEPVEGRLQGRVAGLRPLADVRQRRSVVAEEGGRHLRRVRGEGEEEQGRDADHQRRSGMSTASMSP